MGKKVNYGQFTVKLNNSWSPSTFFQVWTIIPQKIWSDNQKGKMVKIRVLTKKGQFLIFDLENGWLIGDMISRIQLHNFDLMTWLKTFLKINWLIVDFQSTDQKSIVYWKVKLWFFGQNQVSKISIHQNMSKYETYSSRNQKVNISFWKVKISKLWIFSKCWKLHIFSQLWAIFSRWCRMI